MESTSLVLESNITGFDPKEQEWKARATILDYRRPVSASSASSSSGPDSYQIIQPLWGSNWEKIFLYFCEGYSLCIFLWIFLRINQWIVANRKAKKRIKPKNKTQLHTNHIAKKITPWSQYSGTENSTS